MADGATVVRREDNQRVLVEAVILHRRVLLIPYTILYIFADPQNRLE